MVIYAKKGVPRVASQLVELFFGFTQAMDAKGLVNLANSTSFGGIHHLFLVKTW